MATRVVADPALVYGFVSSIMPMQITGGMKGIGLEKDGSLIAGVLYEGFNGHNMFMHVAALPGREWLNREFLHEGFRFPFVTCGVNRVTGFVEASNWRACRFNEHLGFTEETRLRGAASDGGDVILYVMYRDQCRYLGHRYGKQIKQRTST